MPFVSTAQQRYMFAQHPGIARRWADEMRASAPKGKKAHPIRSAGLPKHVSKSRAKWVSLTKKPVVRATDIPPIARKGDRFWNREQIRHERLKEQYNTPTGRARLESEYEKPVQKGMLSDAAGYGRRQPKQTEVRKDLLRAAQMRSPQRFAALGMMAQRSRHKFEANPHKAQSNYNLDRNPFAGPLRRHPAIGGFLLTEAALKVGINLDRGQKVETWT